MKLLVTGGTGFIGSALCRSFAQHGHEVVVLTRQVPPAPFQPAIRYLSWDTPEWRRVLADRDGIINLAGESIAARRWTPRQKQLIRESRLHTTRALIEAMAQGPHRLAVFVSASAVGYYGSREDGSCVESDPPGRGFLAQVCAAWEAEAQRAEAFGIRVIRFRIGLVLGPGGGALAKMVLPFRLGVGGPLGSGRQWMSWIHRDDVVGLIEWVLASSRIQGAVNATAPQPVTMDGFCHEIARALHRPCWMRVPSVGLRLLLGEMAKMLTTGQRVIPEAALQSGYVFTYPTLASALEAALLVSSEKYMTGIANVGKR